MTEVIFNRLSGQSGDLGEICLNRPAALNALSLSMCERIQQQLLSWQQDTGIKAVIIRSACKRAFCAGGDIRWLYHNKQDVAHSLEFFRQEYLLNRTIHDFSKPYIAFLDGITMGGGAGLSLHGSHRIATENFSFAMPETGIGFFPDAGSGYFLNKCPGRSGYYLGLSGEIIDVSDALMLNLVNYHVPREKISAIITALRQTPFDGNDTNAVSRVINPFTQPIGKSQLANVSHLIDDCFGRETIEAIFDALDVMRSSWADRTLRTLMRRSPMSLKVALLYLQSARKQSFDAIMQMELNIALEFMEQHDFYEGVRALLIDKDRTPTWHPAKVADVTEKQLAKFFDHSLDLVIE